VVDDGFKFLDVEKTLLTRFSAPNYLDVFDNSDAILCVNKSLDCSFQVLKGI
ncbi:hypothetical protein AG4045_008706, partial [Apium graveolens]